MKLDFFSPGDWSRIFLLPPLHIKRRLCVLMSNTSHTRAHTQHHHQGSCKWSTSLPNLRSKFNQLPPTSCYALWHLQHLIQPCHVTRGWPPHLCPCRNNVVAIRPLLAPSSSETLLPCFAGTFGIASFLPLALLAEPLLLLRQQMLLLPLP